MRKGFYAAAMIAALVLAACGAAKPPKASEPVAAPATIRALAQGTVEGYVAENGAHAWLAIPFAAAPEGALRFRPPHAAAAWNGTFEALKPAPRCAQSTNRLDSGKGLKPGQVIGAEDCLKLSIYAPAFAPAAVPNGQNRLPVMVWIHGGSNVWGSAADYDGSILAKAENVIVVPVQYRVGPLGWMAHESLAAGSDDPRAASPNFGTMDLIAALEWVKANIAAFGGDPDNVTIFGESAGGHNVLSLVASPLARGLFARAIAESPLSVTTPLAEATGAQGHILNSTKDMLARLGVKPGDDVAAKLRSASVKALLEAARDPATGFIDNPRVIGDDIVIPKAGIAAALADPAAPPVPLLIGNNLEEMKLFQLFDKRLVKKSFGLFPKPRDVGFYEALAQTQAKAWRAEVVDETTRARAGFGRSDVYSYRFDWRAEGHLGPSDFKTLLGAGHAVEIPFVFGRWSFFGKADPAIFTKENEAERLALSRTMMDYWAEFARRGAPATGGRQDLPEWRPVTAGDAHAPGVMVLDAASAGGVRFAAVSETLADVAAAAAADPRLARPGNVCLVLGAVTESAKQLSGPTTALLRPECVAKKG